MFHGIVATIDTSTDTVLVVAAGWRGQWASSYSVTAWDATPDGVYGPIGGARLFPSVTVATEYALREGAKCEAYA